MPQEQVPPEVLDSRRRANVAVKNTFVAILSELLFVLLPLLVLLIVFIHTGKGLWNLMASPELSFASAILMGQTIVKFVSGTSIAGTRSWERIAFTVSIIIVLGLVPSLIILSLVLTTTNVSSGLVWAQVAFFIISVLVFIALGGAGQLFLKLYHPKTDSTSVPSNGRGS